MIESDSLFKILMSKPDPIISGEEPTSDESHKWVKDNEYLNELEQGIPITGKHLWVEELREEGGI